MNLNESPCMSAARTKFQWWIWWGIHNFTCVYDKAWVELWHHCVEFLNFREEILVQRAQSGGVCWTINKDTMFAQNNIETNFATGFFTSEMTSFRYSNLTHWVINKRVLRIFRQLTCSNVDNFGKTKTTWLKYNFFGPDESTFKILVVYNCG